MSSHKNFEPPGRTFPFHNHYLPVVLVAFLLVGFTILTLLGGAGPVLAGDDMQAATPTTSGLMGFGLSTPTVPSQIDVRSLLEQMVLDGVLASGNGYMAEYQAGPLEVEQTLEGMIRTLEIAEGVEFTDLALGATIGWDSDVETGECGFLVRFSSPDDFYKFTISRNGAVALSPMVGGEWSDVYVYPAPNLDTTSGGTNSLAVALQGNRVGIYVNGVLIASLTDSSVPAGGGLRLIAGTYDGSWTQCTFSDVWVWELEPTVASTPGAVVSQTQPLPQHIQSALEQLASLGVIDSVQGRLLVSDVSVVAEANAQDQNAWIEIQGVGDVLNLVIGATLTWESDSERSECGFIARHSAIGAYFAAISRDGYFAFTTITGDSVRNALEIPGIQNMNSANGASNELLFAVNGEEIEVILNGVEAFWGLEYTVTRPGSVMVMANNYGGNRIRCSFERLWVWELP